jgi:hypothetical protein
MEHVSLKIIFKIILEAHIDQFVILLDKHAKID